MDMLLDTLIDILKKDIFYEDVNIEDIKKIASLNSPLKITLLKELLRVIPITGSLEEKILTEPEICYTYCNEIIGDVMNNNVRYYLNKDKFKDIYPKGRFQFISIDPVLKDRGYQVLRVFEASDINKMRVNHREFQDLTLVDISLDSLIFHQYSVVEMWTGEELSCINIVIKSLDMKSKNFLLWRKIV